MLNCIFVGLGGFLGAVLRHVISLVDTGSVKFPINTLFINLIGSVLIGYFAEYAVRKENTNQYLHIFLKTGFCGGFTTYSTFALEYTGLLKQGERLLSFAYIGLSLVLCLGGIFLGEYLAKRTT